MAKVVKIAYFAFSEEYGARHAGFVHSYNIARALSKYLKVTVFFSSLDKLDLNNGGVMTVGITLPSTKNLFRINPLKYFSSFFSILRGVKGSDLVHERFHVNPIDLLFVGNRPYFLEINDPAMVLYSGVKGILYKYLIGLKLIKCRAIITQTETLKKILSVYTNKPIFVDSNGVDTKKFRLKIKNDVRKDLGVKPSDVLVIFVGSFMKWHGVHDVVRLAELFPKVKFLMVGGGPLFYEIKLKTKNLKNIFLVGPKSNDEIPKFLSAADIALAPFSTERFKELDRYGFWWCPVKLFEYMAAGKPIVSYDYSEVRNILKDSGVLAKPGDFEDFAEKFAKILNSKQLRQKLSFKARRLSMKYDWENRGRELYKVYNNILK